MKISLKRLDNSGVAHHLLIALIAIVIVASFGAYKVFFSQASTGYVTRSAVVKVATSEGCWLAGRVWSNSNCTIKCRDTGDTYKTKRGSDGTTRGYCVNAVAVAVSAADCKNYGRRFVHELGCTRKVTDKSALGATQCIYSNHTYVAASGTDRCKLICPSGYTIVSNICVAPKTSTTTQPTTVTTTPTTTTTATTAQTLETVDTTQTATKTCADGKPVNANGLCTDGKQPTVTNTSTNSSVSDTTPLKCPDGSKPDTNGKCTKEVVIAPPPAVNIVVVDSNLSKKDCLLLGREWIPRSNSAGQLKGCSMVSCNKKADSIVTNSGKPFCKSKRFESNYAARLSKSKCKELHRQWVEQVKLCAQFPNQDRKSKKIITADQCVGAYSTYYIRPGKNDECFKPSFFNRAQAVAKKVGSPLGAVLRSGPAAFCNAKKDWTWDSTARECKRDRKVNVAEIGSGGTNDSSQTILAGEALYNVMNACNKREGYEWVRGKCRSNTTTTKLPVAEQNTDDGCNAWILTDWSGKPLEEPVCAG